MWDASNSLSLSLSENWHPSRFIISSFNQERRDESLHGES